MLGVGRDLCGSSSPTPLLKQGHLQQAAHDLVQAGLEYLQRRRLHNLPGQPVPVLRHPQREEFLPHVQLELPLLQFVPIAPCPVTGHHWKESCPVLLTPTLQVFRGISKVPSQPSLLQAKQAQLPQPVLIGEVLQSPHHLCSLKCLLPSVVICLGKDLAEHPSKWVYQPLHGFSSNIIKCCLFGGLLLAMMFALPMSGKEGPCGHP